jgi:hypothetical protein
MSTSNPKFKKLLKLLGSIRNLLDLMLYKFAGAHCSKTKLKNLFFDLFFKGNESLPHKKNRKTHKKKLVKKCYDNFT